MNDLSSHYISMKLEWLCKNNKSESNIKTYNIGYIPEGTE